MQQVLDEAVEVMSCRQNLFEAEKRALAEPRTVPAVQLLSITGNTPQRCFEVVRHRVGKGFQLFVSGPQQFLDALALADFVFPFPVS